MMLWLRVGRALQAALHNGTNVDDRVVETRK